MTVYDFGKCAQELQIDPAVYVRILKSAVSQTEEDMTALSAALAQRNVNPIQEISHRWKGDYDNLRIQTLSQIARELNLAVKNGQEIKSMQALAQQFQQEFHSLKQQIFTLTP